MNTDCIIEEIEKEKEMLSNECKKYKELVNDEIAKREKAISFDYYIFSTIGFFASMLFWLQNIIVDGVEQIGYSNRKEKSSSSGRRG